MSCDVITVVSGVIVAGVIVVGVTAGDLKGVMRIMGSGGSGAIGVGRRGREALHFRSRVSGVMAGVVGGVDA